jgi:hypothetical protein
MGQIMYIKEDCQLPYIPLPIGGEGCDHHTGTKRKGFASFIPLCINLPVLK